MAYNALSLLVLSLVVAHLARQLRTLLTTPLKVAGARSEAAQGWVQSATTRLWATATSNWQRLRGTGPGGLALAGIVGGAGLCLVVAAGEFAIHALAVRLQLHPPTSGSGEPGALTPAEAALPLALVATSIVVGAFVLEHFGHVERSILPRERRASEAAGRSAANFALGWAAVAVLALTLVVNAGFGLIRYGEAVDASRLAASVRQEPSTPVDEAPSLLTDESEPVSVPAEQASADSVNATGAPNTFAFMSVYILLPLLLAVTGVLVGWSLMRLFVAGAVVVTGSLAGIGAVTGWGLATLTHVLHEAADRLIPVLVDVVGAPGRGLWNFLFRPPDLTGRAGWRFPGPIEQDEVAVTALSTGLARRTDHVARRRENDGEVTIADRYRVRRLAEGQFTETFVGVDLENPEGGEVVLKLVKPMADPGWQEAGVNVVEAEATHLEQIDSPHVVRLIDRIDGPRPGIVLPRYPWDLATYLRDNQGKLTFGWAFDTITALLQGADDIYRQAGVIHCDYKDLNVLVDKNGTVVICDLGGAQKQSALRRTGHLTGTDFWRSPEQHLHARIKWHPPTDIWGIGGIAGLIFGGTPPYLREAAVDGRVSAVAWGVLLQSALTEPSVLRRQSLRELDDRIPEPLDRLIGQFLSIDPTARVPGVRMSEAYREALRQWREVASHFDDDVRQHLIDTRGFPTVQIVHDVPRDDE